jgi:predicted nucleic acid-binding protein
MIVDVNGGASSVAAAVVPGVGADQNSLKRLYATLSSACSLDDRHHLARWDVMLALTHAQNQHQ